MRGERLIIPSALHQQHMSLSDVKIHDYCHSRFAVAFDLHPVIARTA